LFSAPQARHRPRSVARPGPHPASATRGVIYPPTACALGRTISVGARGLPLRSPASVVTSRRWHGTINPLSIAYGSHALGLGPANPTRTYLASEPSGYRRAGFPPAFSLLMPASALPRGPP